jgi:hypothetical protein
MTTTQKVEKQYETSLDHMKWFEGKSVIMTGATGAIGSKVAKKLLKAGMLSIIHIFLNRC